VEMKDITLIIVDNVNHDLARFSIEKTLSTIPCKEVITFSDRPIIEGAKFVPIRKNINLYDYSEIMTKQLWTHVETEHVITIQWDGMAVNKDLWDDNFLNYDYIGALWKWPIFTQTVGNGGFSFRSRKLIEALRDNNVRLGTELSGQNEDVAIAVEYRELMEEKYGIKYATPEVASKFATENVWNGPSFGFHGLWNIPRFLPKKEIDFVIDHIPSYYWNDLDKTQQLINILVEQDFEDLAHKVYNLATEDDE
jgi:hypothetical protein